MTACLGQLPGEADAVADAEGEEAEAGTDFHPAHGAIGEATVSEGSAPTQSEEPPADAGGDAGDAKQFAAHCGFDPAVGNEGGAEDDPTEENAGIGQRADESGHEGGGGMEPFFDSGFDLFLDAMFKFVELRHGFGQEKYPTFKIGRASCRERV